MKPESRRIIVSTIVATLLAPSLVLGYSIGEAADDIRNLRFENAASGLAQLILDSSGTKRQRALILLAGLKRSPEEAEILYQEALAIDEKSREAHLAVLEMAKIRFAEGRYRKAFELLRGHEACGTSEESCFFQGLAALLCGELDRAESSFSSIRGTRYKPWAILSLADIDLRRSDTESACDRYRALARARINPVAMYRYGECLEREGEKGRAQEQFRGLIESFGGTFEAVRAAEKLKILEQPSRKEETTIEVVAKPASGFTIQLGSFRERRNAIKLKEGLKDRLPGVRIDTDLVDRRELHRVRYGVFRTREEALAKLRELEHRIDVDMTVMKIP